MTIRDDAWPCTWRQLSGYDLVAEGAITILLRDDRLLLHQLLGLLKGQKPGELPVQLATKFRFALNVKTGKTLGLAFPFALLDNADDMIE